MAGLGVLVLVAALAWGLRIRHDLVDFEVYRTAGARAWAGEPLFRPDDGHYQFKYFPAFALAMGPFAALPAGLSRTAWYVLSVGLLVLFVRLAVRELPAPQRTTRWLTTAAILLLGRHYVHELDLGQTNVLLGLLLLSATAALARGRAVAGGVLAGLAIVVKPYGFVLLPVVVLTGGRAALFAITATVGAGLLLPVLTYGWAGNLSLLAEWYRTVTDTTSPNLIFRENISFAAMWTRWLGEGAAASGLALASAAALGGLVLAALRRRRHVARPEYLELGLLMLVVPLVSPQGWDYLLLLATPAVLVVVNHVDRLSPGWRLPAAAALVVVGFTIFDLVGRTLYTRLMDHSAVTLAAVVLAAVLVRIRARSIA